MGKMVTSKGAKVKRNLIKRAYNFPPELLEAWEEFHTPSKDYSPSAAAAFLAYMTLEPGTREALRKFDYSDKTPTSIIECGKLLLRRN